MTDLRRTEAQRLDRRIDELTGLVRGLTSEIGRVDFDVVEMGDGCQQMVSRGLRLTQLEKRVGELEKKIRELGHSSAEGGGDD